MNIFFKELFKNFNPNQKGFKKKLLSFTFFLLMATIFWYLNALNEKYKQKISYPIKYVNIPKDKGELSNLPKNIKFLVYTSGYNLLEYYLSANIQPIVIDFTQAKETNGSYYILTKWLNEEIQKQLKITDIQKLKPDTINFTFYQIIKKKVPVKALAKYSIKQGYVEKEPISSRPDSIEINGPEKIINRINQVFTGNIELDELSKTTKRNVAIKKIKGVKYSSYRTNVQVSVEQATENQIDIPIKNNNPNIKLIPNTIHLSYKVGLSKYTQINKEQFTATVNFADTIKGDKVLKVELSQSPQDIFEVNYSPNFVEYLIEK